MHPSLRIEALSRLPGTLYRRTAIAAARGSRMDFYALQEDFQRRPAAAQTVELLPVFYVYLDPTVIPLPEELDTMDANVFARLVSKLDTAVKALVNIRAIVRKISEPVALDLWPRLWLWMEFLWRFREWNFLQSLSIPDRLCIYLIVEFGRHKKIKTAMARTRGVRVLLTESWSVGLHQKPAPHPAAQALTALNTTKLLQALIDEPEHIQDVIEGAGGTIDDLASLFVKHLNCAAPLRRESEAVDISAAFWTFVILFIQDFPSDLQTPFFDALQAHKIVPSLVATFCIFADITFADINEAFLHRLTPFLDESSGYPRITEALKAGLLRCVLFCGKTDITDSAQHLLYTILPDAMVYHSVLTQLELSLQDVRGSPDLIASLQPEVQDALSKFMEFAEMRIGVLKWYNSPQHVSLAACDNMDCGRISGRRDFRRCSGCRHAFYCSPECQREDWTEGCHRDFCQNLREHPGHITCKGEGFALTVAPHSYSCHGCFRFPSRCTYLQRSRLPRTCSRHGGFESGCIVVVRSAVRG
ncbi:hypothetical protein C8R43DRAFT_1031501 [Mycena crocata]|nr:hypothetical protein C8R43DRAFT_1031501 [Mycena crocata]